jgi:Dullard-like phosphatase family protein
MRSTRQQKTTTHLQGNILAKSSKLTIEVTDDDDMSSFQKLGKNSPKFSKPPSENSKRLGTTKASIPRTPASSNSIRRALKECNTPVNKVFNFSPKPIKRTSSKPTRLISKRSSSKESSIPKNSFTPTQRKSSSESKKRSQEKEGKESSLSNVVTQVKGKKFNFDAPDVNLQMKSEALYKEHLFQTFQALKFVKTLQPVNLEQLKERRVNVPRRKGFETRKTLIFDLDETLVHCCDEITEGKAMVNLPVVFPTGEVVQAGINVRPYAIECLREVGKWFEVFVFTASHPCYANVVLDYLDPKKELIHQRFFRDSCINMNGVFIKDLRIFANRNLKDIIIVDNAAYSFAYQLDNGIPIISWHNDPFDKELFNLIDYVRALSCVEDVRDVNERTFHLRNFFEDYSEEFLNNESHKVIKKF